MNHSLQILSQILVIIALVYLIISFFKLKGRNKERKRDENFIGNGAQGRVYLTSRGTVEKKI